MLVGELQLVGLNVGILHEITGAWLPHVQIANIALQGFVSLTVTSMEPQGSFSGRETFFFSSPFSDADRISKG
jgi:hypothetical protein